MPAVDVPSSDTAANVGVVLSNGAATGPSGLVLDRPFRAIEARPRQRKRQVFCGRFPCGRPSLAINNGKKRMSECA